MSDEFNMDAIYLGTSDKTGDVLLPLHEASNIFICGDETSGSKRTLMGIINVLASVGHNIYTPKKPSVFNDELEEYVIQAFQEMSERISIFSKGGYGGIEDYNLKNPHNKMSRVFLVLDNVVNVGDKYDITSTKGFSSQFHEVLDRLLTLAGSSGFHIIFHSHHPIVKTIGVGREHFPVQLIHRNSPYKTHALPLHDGTKHSFEPNGVEFVVGFYGGPLEGVYPTWVCRASEESLAGL